MSARQRPLLLGHRGARAVKTIPENTVASFDRCLADGCDGFEFDVRLTADGEAVVCHDPQFQGVEISRTSAAQLAGLTRLEEVIARYHERAFLDVELKVVGLEKIVAALLTKYPPLRGLVVSSFLPQALQSIRAEDDKIPLGLICEKRKEIAAWSQLDVDYIILQYRILDWVTMKRFQRLGKKIFVWTINAGEQIREYAEWGVDGIISDDARLLTQTLS